MKIINKNFINQCNKRTNRLLFLIISTLILSACSSDDGDDGAPGPDGDVNIAITNATTLKATVESVSIADDLTVSVDFYLSNANGVAISGLENEDIPTLGVGIAKLGDLQRRVRPLNSATSATKVDIETAPQWINYINNSVEPGTVADNTLEDGWDKNKGTQWQPSVESDCRQDCLESIGNGQYRYTFSKTLDQYSNIEDLNTSYEPELIHRVYIELLPYSGADVSNLLVNTTFDFDPTTGVAADSADSRNVVSAEQSCYRCHSTDLTADNTLLLHGSKRFDYNGCVMCHTSYAGDPETGAAIDMATLTHKIHQGDYVVIGYGGSVHDYSSVTYPGDIHQCQTCHIDGATEQSAFYTLPGQESCLSCHEKYAPSDWDGTAVGLFHDRDEFPTAWALSCSGCHPDSNNPEGSALFHNAATTLNDTLATQYQFELTSSTLDASTNTLTIKLAFDQLSLNPADDPSVDSIWITAVGNSNQTVMPDNNGQRKVWDITSDADTKLTRNGSEITAVISNVTAADFGLTVGGNVYAKAFVCGDKVTGLSAACDAESAYTVEVNASEPISLIADPSAETYTAVVSEAKCVACHDERFQERVNEAHSIATTPSNGASCGTCHSPKIATGFADGSCRSCHTNDMVQYLHATIKHSPSDITTIKSYRTLTNSLNYRELVHSLHANTRTTTGFHGDDREDITYPAAKNDCRACHDEGQLSLESLSLEPSVIVAAEGATTNGDVSEYSPTVATCATCHQNIDEWIAHARSYGGVYEINAASGAIYNSGDESCKTCHAEGKVNGVDTAHNLN